MRLDEQIAAYGARLGIVEPLFLRMIDQIDRLRLVQEELRVRKDYENADRLRVVIQTMQDATNYAFPARQDRA